MGDISKILKKNSSPFVITLDHTDLDDPNIEKILPTIQQNYTSLVSLNFCWCYLTNKGLELLGEFLKNNNTLTSLNLRGNSITNVRPLAVFLANTKSLTSLNLRGNNISEIRNLARSLESNTTVTSLDLSENDLGPNEAPALSMMCKYNKNLIYLNLRSSNLENSGIQAICHRIAEGTIPLRTLNFRFNYITNSSLKTIGMCFEENKTLETLNLRCNRITDSGLQTLGLFLRSNKVLTTLDLQFNRISRPDILFDALRYNTKLKSIKLKGNDCKY